MDAKVHPLLHRFWWVLPAIASITVLGGSLLPMESSESSRSITHHQH